jgi:ClpP class serine protease
MSGGSLIALAADEIVMDPNAVLGPVDPQVGSMPAASIVKILTAKRPENIEDQTLILADVAAKARTQVGAFVTEVLTKHLPKPKAAALATTLSDGRWTHDFPITVEMAKALGLPVTTDMPRTVYDLMDLYPQGGRGRPSVLYVPLRPGLPERGESAPPAPVHPSSGGK